MTEALGRLPGDLPEEAEGHEWRRIPRTTVNTSSIQRSSVHTILGPEKEDKQTSYLDPAATSFLGEWSLDERESAHRLITPDTPIT